MEMENEDTENYFQDEPQKLTTSHTLIEREFENEINYYCIECDMEYATIDDFAKIHQCDENDFIEIDTADVQPTQWETVDDLISEHEETDEESTEVPSQEIYFEENPPSVTSLSNSNEVYNATAEEEEEGEREEIETIITEQEDTASTGNRYYCYDCRTVFSDFDVAEQHDCPGIANATTDTTEVESNCDQNTKDEEMECRFHTCGYCEEQFQSLAELQKHENEDLCPNKELIIETVQHFQCPICLREFGTIKALNSHSRAHKTKLTVDGDLERSGQAAEVACCDICKTSFTTIRGLKLHMRIHEKRPVQSIQHALPEVAAQKYNRLNHFFCEICNKSFEQNLLTIHKNMHQNVEEFICHTCNRQFENKHSFEVHQQVHSAEKPGDATAVINTGPTEAALRNAKNGVKSTHLATAKQTFPCQYCGHLFWRPHEKVRHERVHTGEKPHACEVCGKRFRIMYSLTLHLRTHTDIRPYVCSTCNKRFKSQSVYTHHLRTHLNERAYKCDICEKSFRTSVQLYGHKNSHTKPFNCTLCNRPFASLYAVKAHMKTHANNKIYENLKHSCNICGAVYARLGALRAHIAEQHDTESNAMSSPTILEQQTIITEEEEVTEIDESALLLITVAADASSRQAEASMLGFDQNDEISVEQEYLNS